MTNPLCPKTEAERDDARADAAMWQQQSAEHKAEAERLRGERDRFLDELLELRPFAERLREGLREVDAHLERHRYLEAHREVRALVPDDDQCDQCDGKGHYTTWPHTTCPACKGSGRQQ